MIREENTWQIKFYGTRGSVPVCDMEYQTFGGNTTCIFLNLLKATEHRVTGIIDAGTGIRKLGKDIESGRISVSDNLFIAFTHYHWDHIQGFPFFAPAYNPKRDITIFTPQDEDKVKNSKEIFEVQMSERYFPVQLHNMGAQFQFLSMADYLNCSPLYQLDEFSTNRHNHPGGAIGYKISAFGSTIVICTDIEHGDSLDLNVLRFCKDADLLIHDAQFTRDELQRHKGWGHSSYDQAIELAARANVKRLIMTHHDPDHTDDFLFQMEKDCQAKFPKCWLAREDMEVLI